MIGKLASYVVRPRRSIYDPQKDLGSSIFYLAGSPCHRIDFQVMNNRNLTLKGSIYYRGQEPSEETAKHACMIYCHGNCGSRTDSFESIKPMLSKNTCVVCFDFAGCGLSEGNYITLGLNESEDIRCIIEYVRKEFKFVDPERIGLWGRSMGAVSSILYSSKYKDASCLVLDSPFSDLSSLLEDYLKKYKLIAKIAGKYILRKLKDKITQHAGFEVNELRPLDHIKDVRCPILFVHSKEDRLIDIKHSRALFQKTEGEKHFLEIEGGHNDRRPQHIYDEIKNFVCKNLNEKEMIPSQANTKAFMYFSSRVRTSQNNSSEKPTGCSEYFMKEEDFEDCNSSSGSPSAPKRAKITTARKLKSITSLPEIARPVTSQLDLNTCSQNDEMTLFLTQRRLEFAQESYKNKETERFKVLVQSFGSTEVAKEENSLILQQSARSLNDSSNSFHNQFLSSVSCHKRNEIQLRNLNTEPLAYTEGRISSCSLPEIFATRPQTLQVPISSKEHSRNGFPNYPKLFGKKYDDSLDAEESNSKSYSRQTILNVKNIVIKPKTGV